MISEDPRFSFCGLHYPHHALSDIDWFCCTSPRLSPASEFLVVVVVAVTRFSCPLHKQLAVLPGCRFPRKCVCCSAYVGVVQAMGLDRAVTGCALCWCLFMGGGGGGSVVWDHGINTVMEESERGTYPPVDGPIFTDK